MVTRPRRLDRRRRARGSTSLLVIAVLLAVVGASGQMPASATLDPGSQRSTYAPTPGQVPAVLALERLNCNTITATGQGGIKVAKQGSNGGWIHTDTAAVPGGTIVTPTATYTSNCVSPPATTCASSTGNAYSLYATALPLGAGGGPAIVAEDNGSTEGRIGAYAQVPGVEGSIGCDYPTGINHATTGDEVISRGPVDAKYDGPGNPYNDNIATRHARGYGLVTGGAPIGYTVIGTGSTGGACSTDNVLYLSAKVYINCPGGFTAKNVLFTGTDFIFNGAVADAGGFLAFPNARDINIRGCLTANGCSSTTGLSVNSGGRFSVNSGMDQCDATQHAMWGGPLVCGSPYITTTWVNAQPLSGTLVPGLVTNGVTDGYRIPSSGANSAWPYVECQWQANGPGNGGSYDNQTSLSTFAASATVQNAEINLCQTSVYIGANTPNYAKQSIVTGGNCSSALPCPSRNSNLLQLNVNTGSHAPVQWTAPLHNSKGPSLGAPFDDLALWTEASGAAGCVLAGQGAVAMSGVFFLPNCSFSYAAQAASNVPINAQLIVRTLVMAGQGVLYLKPNPDQSIAAPPVSDIAWDTTVAGAGSELPRAIEVDASGNTYLAGTFDQTATFGSGAAQQTLASNGAADAFLAKLDPNGSLLWVRRIGGAGTDEGWGLALDASGNPVVTGAFSGSVVVGTGPSAQSIAGVDDMYVASFDPSGALRWIGTGGGAGADKGLDVSIDGNGVVYVGGVVTSTAATFGPNAVSTPGGFVAAYGPNGSPLWARAIGGAGADVVKTVVGLPTGGAVAGGWFDGTLAADTTATQLTSTGGTDGFAASVDATGQVGWLRDIGGSSVDIVWGSTVDASGNVYLSGAFTGTASVGGVPAGALTANGGSTDGFMTRLDPTGTAAWARAYGGSGIDLALGVTFSGSTLLVARAISGESWCGATSRISAGGLDGTVARIDPATGICASETQMASGPGNDFVVDVARGSWDTFVATGNFQDTVSLGESYVPPQLTATGDDLYVAKTKP